MNVLLIQSDQQRYDSLGCNGNPHAVTPHLDALASAGTNFTRHITGNSVCMPSRACLMSGRHVRGHGVWINGVSMPRSDVARDHSPAATHWAEHCRNIESHVPTLADAFSAGGYDTASIGKLHLQPYRDPASMESSERWSDPAQWDWHGPYYGFEHVELCVGHGAVVPGHQLPWLAERFPELANYRQQVRAIRKPFENPGDLYAAPLPAEAHATSYISERAVKYIEGRAGQTKPFFLYVSYPDPHHPFTPPAELAREFESHETLQPVDPRGEREGEASVFPAMRANPPQQAPCPEAVRLIRQYTDAQNHLIDRGVGRIVEALKQQGLWDDTLIVFTSDHGDWLGDYGLLRKDMVASRALNHVPLIIRAPQAARPLPSVVDAPMSNVDLLPTLCELTGVAAPRGVQGRGMLDVLRSGADHAALITNYMPTADLHNFSLCDARYRYTYYPGRQERELYDHQEDPHEMVNLAREKGHESIVQRLHQRLLEEQLATDAPSLARSCQW